MTLPVDNQHAYPTAPTGGSKPSLIDQVVAVTAAAHKWHINPTLLWGVYGVETDYGRNEHNSTAGAVGPFQFLPSTAAGYGYPLTNNPSKTDFQKQADAAAHYLADLGATKDSGIEGALQSYSGHGYGLDKVKEALAPDNQPGGVSFVDNLPGVKQVEKAANAVGAGASAVAGGVSDFFNLLTSLEFWLRLGEGIAGLVLIAMGLKTLTGYQLSSAVPVPV